MAVIRLGLWSEHSISRLHDVHIHLYIFRGIGSIEGVELRFEACLPVQVYIKRRS